jgi:hypothetical protein
MQSENNAADKHPTINFRSLSMPHLSMWHTGL